MTDAVLFDLGNTLVSYYRRDQFRGILDRAIRNVLEELQSRGLTTVSYDEAIEAAVSENREAGDFRFKPMIDRLERVFGLSPESASSIGDLLCLRFLEPVFATARIYEETVLVLQQLRTSGLRTAIVSNLPWGSPTEVWRDELRSLGLLSLVDSVVLCGDVGWRKPARQIFEHAARTLDVTCDRCVFVGDDVQWDIRGSEAVGMHPVLIDRDNDHIDYDGERVTDLRSLL